MSDHELVSVRKDDLLCLVDERARMALVWEEYAAVLRRVRRALAAAERSPVEPSLQLVRMPTEVAETTPERGGLAEPVLMPIWPEGARALGVGRSLMFRLVSEGQIATVKCGRKRLVSPDALRAFVDQLVPTTMGAAR